MLPRLMTATSIAVLMMAVGSAAHAQGKTCKNKVFVDSVYQNSIGGNQYEYMLQLRNGTTAPLHWQIDFRNLPSGVTVFSTQLTSGNDLLPAHGSKTIRFGKGTNGKINTTTVQVTYDTAGGNVIVANCY